MIRIAVAGASGRMGKTILSLAMRDPSFRIVGGVEHPDSPSLGEDLGSVLGGDPIGVFVSPDPNEATREADVLIDFTHPTATPNHLKAALKNRTAYVLGTTGLTEKNFRGIRSASKKIAIVQSPNMSIGVNLLFKLAQAAAQTLDNSYDIEITEVHHRMKRDSPSGTAVKLLEILAQARSQDPKKSAIYGRIGEIGVRPPGKIGVFSLRGGDVVGDHTVFFLGNGEKIELTHRASSREAFALGALRAAKFVAKRKSGLYNMLQVLEIA